MQWVEHGARDRVDAGSTPGRYSFTTRGSEPFATSLVPKPLERDCSTITCSPGMLTCNAVYEK